MLPSLSLNQAALSTSRVAMPFDRLQAGKVVLFELDAVRAQLGDGPLEVVDLERERGVLGRGAAALVQEDQAALAGVDEDALRHVVAHLGLEAELLFVERTRPLQILGGEGGRGGRGAKSCR